MVSHLRPRGGQRTEIVKGYEFEKSRYVVLDDDDMAKARPESTRIINLLRFADVETIDPMYVERPFYLAPDGKVAADAFAVLREALEGKAGIGQAGPPSAASTWSPCSRASRALMMFTLRQAREVRRMSAIEELDDLPKTVSDAEVKLARQVIGSLEGTLDLSEFTDDYQTELRRIIDAKIAGEEVIVHEMETPGQGGQSDGRPPEEPRSGERRQEGPGQGDRQAGQGDVSQARCPRGDEARRRGGPTTQAQARLASVRQPPGRHPKAPPSVYSAAPAAFA